MHELGINRPVHLAGRDIYYEQAVKLLQGDLLQCDVRNRLEICRITIAMLQFAREHADSAICADQKSREEVQFVHYLDLLLSSVRAFEGITRQEHLLMSDRELFCQFFEQDAATVDGSAATHKQSNQYIHAGILQFIQMADGIFRKLKTKNLSELHNGDKKRRYEKATESFQKQMF